MAIQFERDELKNWIHSVALAGCKTHGSFTISKDNTPENIFEALMQVKRHLDMNAVLARLEDSDMSDENPIHLLQLVLIMDYFSRELASLNAGNETAVKMSEILNRISK